VAAGDEPAGGDALRDARPPAGDARRDARPPAGDAGGDARRPADVVLEGLVLGRLPREDVREFRVDC
jgi:hypothetical protein